MIVKRRLNDTNYVLQKSAKSRPFVVHVDWMRCLYSNLLKGPTASYYYARQTTRADRRSKTRYNGCG